MMIDVHAHLFFEELLGAAGDLGPRLEELVDGCDLVTGSMRWHLREASALTTTPNDRVAALDSAGVDLQVATVSPLWLFHHAPAKIAEEFAYSANNHLANWCAETGGRVRGLTQLPTQRPDRAADELRRGVTELGLLGGYIGSDARADLDDAELDELYSACEELDVPLFVHAAMPGIDGPPGDARLERWIGQAVVGYPLEDTIAVRSFLFGDVLDRHPRLDVCFTHGGGAIPFLWGRLKAYANTPASPVSAEELNARMKRLWFDTHLHSADSVALLRSVADPRHLVFGSNFGGWDSESWDSTQPDDSTTNAAVFFRLEHPTVTFAQ